MITIQVNKYLFTFFIFLTAQLSEVSAQAPNWLWAKSCGGAGSEIGYCIATDRAGNIYTAGEFSDTVDFDAGPGIFNLMASGQTDIFIMKSDSHGNLIWAKSIGGPSRDYASSIAIDKSGNVLTTGYFAGTVDFDPDSSAVFNMTMLGGSGLFISKLDSSGNFVWAKQFGGPNGQLSNSIAVDSHGNVYTTGYFRGTCDFNPDTSLVYPLTAAGQSDAFVSKLDSNGNFVWAKRMGGTNFDEGRSVVVDDSGNVYSTGYFWDTADFDPDTTAVYNLTVSGIYDAYILKLDSSGNFVWAKALDGWLTIDPYSIAIDAAGNIYTGGWFQGTIDFDPDTSTTFNLTAIGNFDIFISKLDNSGKFIWAKIMGGGGNDYANSIALDDSANVYTTGYFQGTADFDPGLGASVLTSAGSTNYDVFISRLDSSGNFVWVKGMGGTADDRGYSVTVDATGKVLVTGYFDSPSVIVGSDTITNNGTDDVFIVKSASISPACSAHFTVYPDTTPHNWIAVNQANGVPPITYTWNWGDSSTSAGITPSHTYSDSGYLNICLTITDDNGCTDTYCDSSTFLNRLQEASAMITVTVIDSALILSAPAIDVNPVSFGLYPNPAANYVTIESSILICQYNLYDATGRLLLHAVTNKKHFNIDLKPFSNGLYFLKINDGIRELYKKIIKE